MIESEFWRLIELARAQSPQDDDACAEALFELLIKAGADAIIGFENVLSAKIAALSNFDVLAANFMIQSYVSDDVFKDFRAWLVSQGRTRYELAKSDIETISEWLDRDIVNEIDGLAFVTLAVAAYVEAGGSEDDFYKQVDFVPDADFEDNWPDAKAGFEAQWPKLCSKFWNQERIEELHAGNQI